VVVDSSLRIPREAKLIRTAAEVPVVIATTALAPRSRIKELSRFAGVEILEVKSKDKKVSLKVLFKKLAKRNIVNVLVEGGGELVGSLCDEALVDEWMFFISPKVMGGNRASVKGRGAENINRVLELEEVGFTKFGEDFLVRGRTCSRG
jgi:diaminohydroxyphosphoribosylaminopyrimidine deaminase/5-amino-6-(5-phosphoribosylamino)uracil reductase